MHTLYYTNIYTTYHTLYSYIGYDQKSYGINNIDEFLFHSPYNKLVQKSFSRLVYLDILAGKLPEYEGLIQPWVNIATHQTYEDKALETKLKDISTILYNNKVATGCILSKQIGNTYTAAVYMNLAYLVSAKGERLIGKKIALFSYGSGAMASLFEITPRIPTSTTTTSTTTSTTNNTNNSNKYFTLQYIQQSLDISNRLIDRQKLTPIDLTSTLEIREVAHSNSVPYYPICSIDQLYPGTYYLDEISANYERKYKQKSYLLKRSDVPIISLKPTTNDINSNIVSNDDEYEGGIDIDGDDRFPHPSSLPAGSTSDLHASLTSSRYNNAADTGIIGSGSNGALNGNSNGNGALTQKLKPLGGQGGGLKRSETQVWASGKSLVKVVVTGVAAVLPGRDKYAITKDGSNNIERMINGENFITPTPKHVIEAMIEKNVYETVKNPETGKAVYRVLLL